MIPKHRTAAPMAALVMFDVYPTTVIWFQPYFTHPSWRIWEHDLHTDNIHIFFIVPNFALIIGGPDANGNLDTVEVVSPDPISNPVPDCMKVLGNFPKKIRAAVGTTFGKLNQSYKILSSHSLLLLTRKCTSCVRRYRWRRQFSKPLLAIWRHTWSVDPCRQVSVMQCLKANTVCKKVFAAKLL